MTDIAQRPAAGVGPRLFAAMLRLKVPHDRLWIGWIAPAIIVVAWQASASLGWIADTVMPSPYAVAAAAWRLTLSGELPQNLGVSALRALAGLVDGGAIGLMLGLLNEISRICQRPQLPGAIVKQGCDGVAHLNHDEADRTRLD